MEIMESLAGSVTQRSFVSATGTTVLHAAAAPISELDFDENEPSATLAEILGVPLGLLCNSVEYAEIAQGRRVQPDYPFDRVRAELGPSSLHLEMYLDFGLMVQNDTLRQVVESDFDFTFMPPEKSDMCALLLGARLLAARRPQRSRGQLEFLHAIAACDLPMGQSPKIKSKPLRDLLTDPKMVWVLPMAFGAKAIGSHLAAQNYLAAILTGGLSAASSLVFLGAFETGRLLQDRIVKRRRQPRTRKKS